MRLTLGLCQPNGSRRLEFGSFPRKHPSFSIFDMRATRFLLHFLNSRCLVFAAILTASIGCLVFLPGCTAPGGPLIPEYSSAPDDGIYRLREGDVILLEVFQEPYMTTRQRILGDGTISVGLIGRVVVAGETIAGASHKIAGLLDQKQLVNPQVIITVESYSPRRFTVWGQVRNPGSFVIPGEDKITLPEAITMAGGNSDIGDPRSVVITRRGPSGQQKMKVNALSPQAEQIYIREGDVIRVSETLF